MKSVNSVDSDAFKVVFNGTILNRARLVSKKERKASLIPMLAICLEIQLNLEE